MFTRVCHGPKNPLKSEALHNILQNAGFLWLSIVGSQINNQTGGLPSVACP